jgi:hypothetical protein
MAKAEYRQGDKFGQRFLTSQEFGRYAEDLKLIETSVPDGLLAFLEQERLLVPICRIRYPAEIMRRWCMEEYPSNVDPSLSIETNSARLEAASELIRQLTNWPLHSLRSTALQSHPLDTLDSAYEVFIERNLTAIPFQPWETFPVTVGQENGRPISENPVTSYYHYWQVFLLAEILQMRLSILLDLRNEDVWQKFCDGKLAEIPPERQSGTIHLATVRIIEEFPQYRPAFHALAFYYAYLDHAARIIIRDQQGPTNDLTAEQRNALREQETSLASAACERWNLDDQAVLNFLKWQCGRW